MLTKIIMLTILLSMGLLVLIRDSKGKKNGFFDRDTTNCMRGFWCLVILLVHIPQEYQNSIQDMIGSFAYIGVTFFFMTSGYGLMMGIQKNGADSVKGFWLRRLPKIVLPMFIANIIISFANFAQKGSYDFSDLINVNGFVRQLIIFYFIFWLVFRVLPQSILLVHKTIMICLCVMAVSLVSYFLKFNAWPTESFGFIYGILLSQYKTKFEKFADNKWLVKCAGFCLTSAVIGIAYIKIKHIAFIGDYIVKILLGLSILMFILLLNFRIPVGNAVSRFLGKISYEVYLLHIAAFAILTALPVNIDSGLYVLFSIIITVVLSVIVNFVQSRLLRLLAIQREKN